ncbi:cucumisin-like [Pyrus ussuriensis x Pyrus communis]|uniref:Cucumisin-like n=1 Tax=Pyrus ussuriensis x Pyrus communis TaxID=2448454 RepID=A0A5N5EVK8_9ROSA|nr:cucumisin-like [Pyrus ussuriensis x Pyrus communis]
MAKHAASLFSYALSALLHTASLSCEAIDSDDRKVCIVNIGSLPNDEAYSPPSQHLGMLERVVGSNSAANVLVQSYKRSFNGFAAKLTDPESERLANMKEVVSVFPSKTFQLQTTRSWDFMGVSENITRNATAESDVIVDEGFGPAPRKWKGVCKGGQNFTCNNKIIGARFYNPTESARDIIGCGYGLAQGTARGGVPSCRIAAYSVCNVEGCSADGLLGAFDDAIADGVDIISISIGPSSAAPFHYDPIAIGAFHAMEKGILTSNAAGNNGPEEGTVSSVAPCILTVAASSIDRRIIDMVVLGNKRTLIGSSVNSFTLNGTSFPLIYRKDASRICPELSAGNCEPDCLDGNLVKGKIVLCDQYVGNVEAHKAGALGSVLNTSNADASFIVPLPATGLSNQEYGIIKSYLKSMKDPQADILPSEVIKDDTAPVVSFSSRGPNPILLEIIKPDISAPGADILAAYSPDAPITQSRGDKRRVKYKIASGTSMACPNSSGVAAFIKTIHPDWSPAAIKSSLMTTAKPMNRTNTSPGEFAYGSGHIDSVKAETTPLAPQVLKKDHNYPSMAAKVTPMKSFMAKILPGPKVDIKVVPEVLSFKSLNEEKNFNLTIVRTGLPDGSHVSAELIWSEETHSIRSPILISSSVM